MWMLASGSTAGAGRSAALDQSARAQSDASGCHCHQAACVASGSRKISVKRRRNRRIMLSQK
jgi:hypothetical protein